MWDLDHAVGSRAMALVAVSHFLVFLPFRR